MSHYAFNVIYWDTKLSFNKTWMKHTHFYQPWRYDLPIHFILHLLSKLHSAQYCCCWSMIVSFFALFPRPLWPGFEGFNPIWKHRSACVTRQSYENDTRAPNTRKGSSCVCACACVEVEFNGCIFGRPNDWLCILDPRLNKKKCSDKGEINLIGNNTLKGSGVREEHDETIWQGCLGYCAEAQKGIHPPTLNHHRSAIDGKDGCHNDWETAGIEESCLFTIHYPDTKRSRITSEPEVHTC